jgi:uncharacterized membrane protein
MKKLKISNPFWQVVGLGALAGMRSASAPAITSHILSHHQHSKKMNKSALNFMQSNAVANALKIAAVAEFVMDKLPSTPNRIKPVILAGRLLSGVLVGASIYKASGNKPVVGAVLGGAAAVASSFGMFFLRKGAVKRLGIFDPIIGAVEDALVVGAGVGLVRST